MTEFAIGDVVQLKSGGPQMTVVVPAEDDDDKPVQVAYFNQQLEMHMTTLPQDALKILVSSRVLGGALVAEATEKPAGYVDIVGVERGA